MGTWSVSDERLRFTASAHYSRIVPQWKHVSGGVAMMNECGGNGQCFVISPIGDEGSPERLHADKVFNHIIQPAVAQCNLTAVRSDQIEAPGLISTEMYKRILGDEICIVVLTGMNPNVFYELAIAHAAARPVVLLMQKGELPPFDIKDHRCVEYDVNNEAALNEGVYATSVSKHVTALLKSVDRPTVPFDKTLSPLAANVGWRIAGRAERTALRRFFGEDALDERVIALTLPVYHPLVYDNFQGTAEVTMMRKTDENGQELRRPVYGDVIHFDDYQSAHEIIELLGELGAHGVELRADSEFLGHWGDTPCVICVGSPFVNAALGELGRLSEDVDGAWISGTRTSPTLDTYRVVIRTPQHLALRVDQTHALGVVVRLPNPSSQGNWVVGVWGCRAQSTYATARFLHRSFMEFAGGAEAPPTVMLLAVRGQNLNFAAPMYVARDGTVVKRDDNLLRWYLCPESDEASATSSGNAS